MKFLRTTFLQNIERLLLKNNYQVFKNLFQIFLIYKFSFTKTGESFTDSLLFVAVEKQCRSSRSEVFCLKDIVKNFTKFKGKHQWHSLSLNKVAGFRPQKFPKILRHVSYRTPLVAASDSKIIYFPIPHFSFPMITKQVNKQMFFIAGRNFQIFTAQIVLLIMLPFLNGKTECFTGKYQEIKISRFLKTIFEEKNFYQSWEYTFLFREQHRTQNPAKHMRWRDLRKQLIVRSC